MSICTVNGFLLLSLPSRSFPLPPSPSLSVPLPPSPSLNLPLPPSISLPLPPSPSLSLLLFQVAESQGRVRIITSDGEFERELRQAGESLVVVDFTADW